MRRVGDGHRPDNSAYTSSSGGNRGETAGFRPRSPGKTRRITILFQFPVPSRVEEWRGCLGLAYLLPALSVAGASIASPCPVSTPRSSNRTGPFKASGSRTRLDHPFAHGEPPPHPRRLCSPRSSYKWPFGNRVFPGPRTLYLAFNHRRSRYRTWLSTRR